MLERLCLASALLFFAGAGIAQPVSLPAAHVSPSGANATARSLPISQPYCRIGSQVAVSHIVTVVSLLVVASSLPSGENAAAVKCLREVLVRVIAG